MVAKPVSASKVGLVAALLLLNGGCARLPALFERGWSDLKLLMGFGRGEGAASQGRNAELLYEMLTVVLLENPQEGEYNAWLNSLDQGASLEGVYNALTHSSHYRNLEETRLGATPRSIKVFAREFAGLQKESPKPTPVDRSLAQALAAPIDPAQPESPELARQIRFGASAPRSTLRPNLEQIERTFIGASLFTLKRVLGDEALKLLSHYANSRERVAAWYADWVVKAAEEGVNFGLDLRMRKDRGFHLKWALAASNDLLTWEVLNRLHRLVNAGELQRPEKTSDAGSGSASVLPLGH